MFNINYGQILSTIIKLIKANSFKTKITFHESSFTPERVKNNLELYQHPH